MYKDKSKKYQAWKRWYEKYKNTPTEVERRKKKARTHRLKTEYNLTTIQWENIFNNQNKRCAICKINVPEGKGKWCVDHCHTTNKIRGILCHNCNVGLGNLKDNILILEAAIKYLKDNSNG